MTDSNVINLSPRATDIDQQQNSAGQIKVAQEAKLIAALCLMPALAYERERVKAAKKLGCRVSFLDQKVEQVRTAIAQFRADREILCTNSRVGWCIDFKIDDASFVPSWCLASGEKRWGERKGQETNLLILADGNATIVRGSELNFVPLPERSRRRRLCSYTQGRPTAVLVAV
jgi:hypothetical protein